ncbi:proline-rich receptor-like protein kinase PERK9 [Iris pallida]|uniref:Proline-rich receptor-like protein kinase PERK9 n=1 Tax=Iris pallida TaxID=29817 RepID=A0AAX6HBW9_IRIPA|nr:proline-rich receptor-like protein kinase PERK9 [Iris pallida]
MRTARHGRVSMLPTEDACGHGGMGSIGGRRWVVVDSEEAAVGGCSGSEGATLCGGDEGVGAGSCWGQVTLKVVVVYEDVGGWPKDGCLLVGAGRWW